MRKATLEHSLSRYSDEFLTSVRKADNNAEPLLRFVELTKEVCSDAAAVLRIAEMSEFEREHAEEGDPVPLSEYGEGVLRRLAANALEMLNSEACHVEEWFEKYGKWEGK